jgi:hypothetical protein
MSIFHFQYIHPPLLRNVFLFVYYMLFYSLFILIFNVLYALYIFYTHMCYIYFISEKTVSYSRRTLLHSASLVLYKYVYIYILQTFYILQYMCGGLDTSVGIATRYGLDGPRIEFRWGRDFPHLSRPALGPTQPPVK